jgi:phosphoenolpyruvate carboxylase
MVFKRRELLGGDTDPNINMSGRIDGRKAEPLTNREVRNREFISLIRKLKPHLSSSVKTVMEIIESEDSSDQNKLKSAALVLQIYRELIKDVYSTEYDEQEGQEIQPTTKAPVFSLTMISGGKEIDKVEE